MQDNPIDQFKFFFCTFQDYCLKIKNNPQHQENTKNCQ